MTTSELIAGLRALAAQDGMLTREADLLTLLDYMATLKLADASQMYIKLLASKSRKHAE